MPSRREFLQAGVAASVLPWAIPDGESSAVGWRMNAVTRDVHPVYKVVSDVRFAQGAAFGREAERLGADLIRISGDITDFWFGDLSLRWKDRPVAIAGLTAHGPIFCLERLAWNHGMRVVFRGEHRILDKDRIGHSISGPPATIARARILAVVGPQWAQCVARLVTACDAGRPSPEVATMTALSTHRPDELHEPLVSWVIAPIRRPVKGRPT
jgi:hypothetical protein